MSSLKNVLPFLPRVVLQSLQDARRSFVYVETATSTARECLGDASSAAPCRLFKTDDVGAGVRSVLEQVTLSSSTAPTELIYDVVRVKGRRPVFYTQHMQRFLNSMCDFMVREKILEESICRSCCVDADDVNEGTMVGWPEWFRPFDTAVRQVIAAQPEEDIEQNVKVIAWYSSYDARGARSTDIRDVASMLEHMSVAAFFIASAYPPSSWYSASGGAQVALLYNASRVHPNAKIVQAPLRQRAADQQTCLSVFESILVHSSEDHFKTPEGSRSNILCILETEDGGDAGRVTVLCSLDKDILVGVTLSALRQRARRYIRSKSGQSSVTEEGDVRFEWVQRDILLSDVVRARSLVMLGTSVGVLPLSSVVVFADATEELMFNTYVAEKELYAPVDVEHDEGSGRRLGRLQKRSNSDPVVQLLMRLYNEAHVEGTPSC